MTHHVAAECSLVTRVRKVETPVITELVAALFHLENIAQSAATPQEQAAAQHSGTPERHRRFVLDNAARIQRALDTITAPYQEPTSRTAPAAHI